MYQYKRSPYRQNRRLRSTSHKQVTNVHSCRTYHRPSRSSSLRKASKNHKRRFYRECSDSIVTPLKRNGVGRVCSSRMLRCVISHCRGAMHRIMLHFRVRSNVIIVPGAARVRHVGRGLRVFSGRVRVLQTLSGKRPLVKGPRGPSFISSSIG